MKLSHTVTRGPPESWKDRFASVFAQTLSKTSRKDEGKNSHNSLGLSLNKDSDSWGSSSACTWRQLVWWSAPRRGEQSWDSCRTSAVGAGRQQTAGAEVYGRLCVVPVWCESCAMRVHLPGHSEASTTHHKQLSTGQDGLMWHTEDPKKTQKVNWIRNAWKHNVSSWATCGKIPQCEVMLQSFQCE